MKTSISLSHTHTLSLSSFFCPSTVYLSLSLSLTHSFFLSTSGSCLHENLYLSLSHTHTLSHFLFLSLYCISISLAAPLFLSPYHYPHLCFFISISTSSLYISLRLYSSYLYLSLFLCPSALSLSFPHFLTSLISVHHSHSLTPSYLCPSLPHHTYSLSHSLSLFLSLNLFTHVHWTRAKRMKRKL